MDAHIVAMHGRQSNEKPQQFKCAIPNCGFFTICAGPLTRHYRERHHTEPPLTGRKIPPKRPRLKQVATEAQQPAGMASGPGVPSFPAPSAQSLEPQLSHSPSPLPATDATRSTSSTHYRASVYESAAPTSSTPPATSDTVLHPNSQNHAYNSFTLLYTDAREQNVELESMSRYSSIPRSLSFTGMSRLERTDNEHSVGAWVSWRDESDISSETIALATGDLSLCDASMQMSMTEYLQLYNDFGMEDDKQRLWA